MVDEALHMVKYRGQTHYPFIRYRFGSWLDQLGVSAAMGVRVVMRQSLYGRYSLDRPMNGFGDPVNFTLDYNLLYNNMDPTPVS